MKFIQHMSITNKYFIIALAFIVQLGCKDTGIHYDATGTFEATEIIVSAETTGKILAFNKEEGEKISRNELIAVIDTTLLVMQRDQAKSTINAVTEKQNSAGPQIDILKQQLKAAEADLNSLYTQLSVLQKEQIRVNNLYAARAATEQQYDEINGKVDVLKKNIEAAETKKAIINTQMASTKSQINIQNRGITSEKMPIEKQIEILTEQIDRSSIESSIEGTLLSKYAEKGEMIMAGKPLFKMANLSVMELRAYVTGDQLPQIKIGQKVKVFVDQNASDYKSYDGEITWISDKAEFTPKTIQTKNERANLVYAIKIKVANDGYIKIGMYGEVALNKAEEN